MKRLSLASMHDPICVEKGGEENALKYSYLQITVCMSPCCLGSGACFLPTLVSDSLFLPTKKDEAKGDKLPKIK
jgi:hypothetical protein